MDATLIDSLKEGDMFKTEDGVIGIRLYGKIFASNPVRFCDKITEVKKGLFNEIVDGGVNFEKLWDSIEQYELIFLGVSYQALPTDIQEARELLEDFDTIEYDPFVSTEDNNKKLREVSRHIIVPPSDFVDTHIIGKGLLLQIKERQKVGKSSEIYVSGSIFPIVEVYELKGEDYTKAAVVIY